MGTDNERGHADTEGDAAAPSEDYYLLDETLSEEERAIRDRVRSFGEREVLPIINDYWERAEFPFELVPKLAELNVAGTTIQGHGCPGMSRLGAGIVARELARADGSINTFFGVHSGLAMGAIDLLGSDEQKERWLPPMARLEKIGAFGLTEPEHGSDSVSLETTARREGDEFVLNGAKRWIGNASFADVVIIWARDEAGDVGAYLVEKGTTGFDPSTVITGKIGKRAVWQAEISLDDVRIPAEDKLVHANSFNDASRVLNQTRGGAAWECVGHAVACLEAAVAYASERSQFGQPIGGFQLAGASSRRCWPRRPRCSSCASASPSCRRRRHDRSDGVAGQAAQRPQGEARVLGGSRHPRRQRAAARVSRRPSPDRPRDRGHLRGHGHDPVADRRTRYDRDLRLHLSRGSAGSTGRSGKLDLEVGAGWRGREGT